MNITKIKLGVVGLGYVATQTHLLLLQKMTDVQVVAICDRDPQRLEKARRLFRIEKGYTDMVTMLREQKLDVVVICTPPGSHKELCLQAFDVGVNVMVEKPFTTTVADADAVIDAAKRKNLHLHILHNQSYLPIYLKAKELLRSGKIGEVLNVHITMATPFNKEKAFLDPAHWTSLLPGGVLGEVVPHAAMLFLEFLDTNSVDEVYAVAVNSNGYSNLKADQMIMTVRTGNRIGSCCVTCAPACRTTIDIIGTKLWVCIDGEAQIIIKYPPANNFRERAARVVYDMSQRIGCIIPAAMNVALGRYRQTLGQEYLFKESIKEIRGEGVYPITLEKVREAVRILEIAFKQTNLLPDK